MSEPSQDKVAITALFAALVEALDEKTPGLAQSFARHLAEAEGRMQESGDRGAAAMLASTRALLRDDHDRTEPAAVVYPKPFNVEQDQLASTDKVQLATLEEAVLFWARLPTFDREHSSVETASGHRFDASALVSMAKRYKALPAA